MAAFFPPAWRRRAPVYWVIVAAIFVASSAVRLRGLDNPYITLWDESVQVNVISNLVDHCCTPQLHLDAEGANANDWMDSHIWLHKPPLPLLFNAAVAAPWANRLFGIRFGAFLAAQLIVLLTFGIGLRFFGPATALVATALIAFNRYTFGLVQGTEFSGIPDLTLVCALLGALYALLAIVDHGRRRHFVAFGVLSGVAFLCKDGLALVPFAVLGIVVLLRGWRQHLVDFALAVTAALVIIVPASAYLALTFPAEAILEQRERVDHLLRDVDGWGRPADFYWTVYLPKITSPLISGAAYVAIACAVTIYRGDRKRLVLGLWALSYLVVLSAGVSKIHNFIYPTVPALYLLIPAVVVRLWPEQRDVVILAGAATVGITAVVLHWHLFQSTTWLVARPTLGARAALVGIQAAVVAAVVATLRITRVPALRQITAFSVALALAIVLVTSAHASWADASRRGRDAAEQMRLREAALDLRSLSKTDLVLVSWPQLRQAHLYVKYWSGLDSFEVNNAHPVDARLQQLTSARSIYLLSATLRGATKGTPIGVSGHLYRLR